MRKLLSIFLMSFLCLGASSISGSLTTQAKNNLDKDMSLNKLTAAQEQCFLMKIMYICPEIVLADMEPKEEPVVEEKAVVSRGHKAEAVVEKTGRPSTEDLTPPKLSQEVQDAMDCRLLALMECGVDVSDYAVPALPVGNPREKAVTR